MRLSRHLPAVAMSVVAAGAALAAAAPARAAEPPTYTCDKVVSASLFLVGQGNCVASHGAVTAGEFEGTTILAPRRGPRLVCSFGDTALPDFVRAFGCRPAR